MSVRRSRSTETPEERVRLVEEGATRLRKGEFFLAHESFEDLWKAATTHLGRETWQGLSQVSAALLKHTRGESATAISLLAKARSRMLGASLGGEAGAAMRLWLDALAGPVTGEKELPSTALPGEVLPALLALARGD
jgi:hypothetical protein